MYATPFKVFSQSLDISFYFSCSLSLSYLVFEDSIDASFEIRNSFLSHIQSTNKLIKDLFYSYYSILIFSISFSFLEFPSQFTLSVLAGCLPITAFGISVTIGLKFPVWQFQHPYHVWFWYLLWLFNFFFFLPLICLQIFSYELNNDNIE